MTTEWEDSWFGPSFSTWRNHKVIIHFILERETKGAVRYMETIDSVSDVPKDIASGAAIGTLYIRKSALNGRIPVRLEVEVKSI